ncbi:competence protein [Flavobacterium piscis]|uniref:ABC-type multidrug transport system fused ATPase/permease subunit n=1 Tax=Flavobacterium piscis TaxID=1114874 RepID=A0ABU1Y399_9FLAO|nr:competence protein [Flavobacterium piscis]MDR7208679.1 ABC-type multidrug transport system fused ATPase/permease subunit [Flavobacterium piscis]
MAFEELKENTENIQEQAKVYFDSHLAYYKLWGFKVAMKSTTLIFKFALILLCFSMVLFFGSFAAAYAFGSFFESNALGFLTVGGIYFVLTILLFFVKDKFVEGPILEKFSDIFFND